jgi:HEAT repeat protein
MDPLLVSLLLIAAGAAVGAGVVLVAIKFAHRELQRWRGVRTAHYVAAVGELISRDLIPTDPPRGWAEDPLFHDALADYALLLTGGERAIVDGLVTHLGIVEVLRKRIRRRFPITTRLRSVSSLVDLANQAHVPDLRALLDDGNTHVRVHAIRGLARLDDVVSVSRILDLGAGVRQWEAARIADALVAFGPAATPAITEWLGRESGRHGAPVEMVALATRALGLIGDPAAEPVLIGLLHAELPDWRVAAASALEHAGTEQAVPHLLEALGDVSWRVRARAATALGGLADPDSPAALAPLLRDRVWWVRQNAAAALGRVPGGTAVLVDALDGDDAYAGDAALAHLTTSGEVAEAARRTSNGTATEVDARLLRHVGHAADQRTRPVGEAAR